MRKLVISEITNDILYATVKDLGNGNYAVTGKQEIMTEEVLKAAFSWFMQAYEKQEKAKAVYIGFKESPYRLVFGKKENFKYYGDYDERND